MVLRKREAIGVGEVCVQFHFVCCVARDEEFVGVDERGIREGTFYCRSHAELWFWALVPLTLRIAQNLAWDGKGEPNGRLNTRWLLRIILIIHTLYESGRSPTNGHISWYFIGIKLSKTEEILSHWALVRHLFSYCLECTKVFCIAWVFWRCDYTTWVLLWDIWPNFSCHLDGSTISWEGVAWSKHYSAKLEHVYGVSVQTILSFWVKCHEKPHVSAANTHIYVRVVLEVVTMFKMCEPTTVGFCWILHGVRICC